MRDHFLDPPLIQQQSRIYVSRRPVAVSCSLLRSFVAAGLETAMAFRVPTEIENVINSFALLSKYNYALTSKFPTYYPFRKSSYVCLLIGISKFLFVSSILNELHINK